MKSIILVGYMCVGKTTVGRTLAKELGCTFYDLDWYIEERFHTKVSKIFAEKGEAHFRDLVVVWRRNSLFLRQYGLHEQCGRGVLS